MYIPEALCHGGCGVIPWVSMGQVNLKHLLWQMREQQSALSDVTLLRQEVPLRVSFPQLICSFRFISFRMFKGLIDEIENFRS